MTKEEHESTSKLVGKEGCECGSSDGNAVYDDGHKYCFVCGAYTHATPNTTTTERANSMDIPKHLKFGPLKDRGLTGDTLRKYGVRLKVKDGIPIEHFYPYHDSKGNLVAWKIRDVSSKGFATSGEIQKGVLFGQTEFTNSGKYVTICEGEIDTMSVYQMQGSKYTAVGIKNGAQAAYTDCKKAYEWLNTFENIIICFDSDDPGKEAARKVASLFPNKGKVVKLELKDAGKYLEAGDIKGFTQRWWAAEEYLPDDIIGKSQMWDIINKASPTARWQYPWENLNKMTYGMRTGELVMFTAGSGTGKTTLLREIAYSVLSQSKDNLGLLFLEEQNKQTGKGMMTMDASIPFHLPDAHYTPDDMEKAYEHTWGTGRIFTLEDSLAENDVDYIADKIKFLAIGRECKLIILDHVSFMVSDQAGDERKMLDEIAHKLKSLATSLDIHIAAVAHTKRTQGKSLEEGAQVHLSDLRGTAGLGQLSDMVIGLERNGQAESEKERNTTLVRVIKNRFCGRTGPATSLYFDENLGRMSEVELSDLNEETK